MTNPMAPSLPDLSPKAELALLARILHREGYDDQLAGHITYKQPDGTLLVNPFGLTWDEVRAADIMRIDVEGEVLDGPWTVTPAITLHLELHRVRHDAGLVIHNHPQYCTVWADLGRVPDVYDQSSAFYAGPVALYDDYQGAVNDRENAAAAVKALGDADVALLANHGVLVVGRDIRQAHLRAVSFEWRCRKAWQVAAAGGGRPMRPDVVQRFGGVFDRFPFPGMFEAAARRQLRLDPSVLEE
jgi:ribulose-5-phosphate 4-epimerase/fuculose-1-phosphate aldolase